MDRKWPLDLEVAPDAIRAKVDELLARDGEFTPLWRHGLSRIHAEADTIAAIVAASEDQRIDARPQLLEMAARFGEDLTPDMAEEFKRNDMDDRDASAAHLLRSGLTIAITMASDIVEGIARATMDDAGRIMGGEPAEFLEDAIQIGLAAIKDDILLEIAAAMQEAEEAEQRSETAQNGKQAEITRLQTAIDLKVARGAARGRKRVAQVVEGAMQNYGLPDRMRPRLDEALERGGTIRYHWGAGLPAADGPPMSGDDVRRHVLPNGYFEIPLAINSIGDLQAVNMSRVASQMQRILLILGRDVEIDGFDADLAQPPLWCHAAALPLARLLASGNASEFETDGGIAGCNMYPIGESGTASLSSDPLLHGTTLVYHGMLPETIKTALATQADVPLRNIVSHDAFDDDRIVVRRAEEQSDGSMIFYLDCPVVRVALMPANIGLEEDPITAWSDYGSRLDVDAFYERIREATKTQNMTVDV